MQNSKGQVLLLYNIQLDQGQMGDQVQEYVPGQYLGSLEERSQQLVTKNLFWLSQSEKYFGVGLD